MNAHLIASLYNAILALILVVGTGYAVFVLDRSGWWFLAAVALYAVMNFSVTRSEDY